MAAAVPRETPRTTARYAKSDTTIGSRKRMDEVYQKATANDTTSTAALISKRMNFILPLRTMRNMAVALAPRAITKMMALRPAELNVSPWKGVTWAWGTGWFGFEIGYPS